MDFRHTACCDFQYSIFNVHRPAQLSHYIRRSHSHDLLLYSIKPRVVSKYVMCLKPSRHVETCATGILIFSKVSTLFEVSINNGRYKGNQNRKQVQMRNRIILKIVKFEHRLDKIAIARGHASFCRTGGDCVRINKRGCEMQQRSSAADSE